MNKSEENSLTMLQATWSILNANVEKLGLPALRTAVGDFEALLGKVKDLVQQTMTATAGKAETKAKCKDALLEDLMALVGAMLAYGHRVDDTEVIGTARVTRSELEYMRDTNLVARAVTIHEVAVGKQSSLADYGITAAKLESLKGRIDAFEAALGDRESSVARRKGARSSFRAYMDQAKDLLENEVDNLMADFKRSGPEFYNEYIEAGSVKNVGLRHKVPPAAEVQAPPRSETA